MITAAEKAWLGFTPMEASATASMVQLWRRNELPGRPEFDRWSAEFAREAWELITAANKDGLAKDDLIQLLTTMGCWSEDTADYQWVPKGWSAEPVAEQDPGKKTTIPRGEEIWVKAEDGNVVGTVWRAKNLFQFEGTIYRVADAVSLSVSVWEQVKHLDRFEMVKGNDLLRWCSGTDARATTKEWNTRNGPRMMVPLSVWTEA